MVKFPLLNVPEVRSFEATADVDIEAASVCFKKPSSPSRMSRLKTDMGSFPSYAKYESAYEVALEFT
jgi:hypothetical protein